ncbi:MAG TPA: TVP38/TMEM64 family protein [Gemmataceae bacterium]|nr:TVP38/TMEM64 family protein [Gemmataceae bacterium]
MTKSTAPRAFAGLILIVAVVAAFVLLPIKQYLADFVDWVQGLGWWGALVFGLVYAVAGLAIPGSILTLGAGFAFGVVFGTVVVSLSSVTTAVLAFWLGRTLFRAWVAAKVAANPKFRALDQAVAENGFKIVFLTRLSPVFPFTLLNYTFGLTKVRFRDYLIASWIGMLPGTVLYVYLGSAIHDVADLAAGNVERTPAQTVFFWVGLAVTALVTVLVTRIARNALRQVVPTTPQGVPHD